MIRPGTLCYVVNVRNPALAQANGRIVEITGAIETMTAPEGDTFSGYPIKPIWIHFGPLRAKVSGMAPEHLRPIHDPDWRETTPTREEVRA